MKIFSLGCLVPLLFIIVSGCANIPPGTDPLADTYESLQGTQANNPTAPNVYVQDIYGVNFYHGLPNFQYTVIGCYNRPNLPLDKLAAGALAHDCRTVMLTADTITAQHDDPTTQRHHGTRNNYTITTAGGDSYVTKKTLLTAYLIRPLDTTNFIAPTSQPPIDPGPTLSPRQTNPTHNTTTPKTQ